MVARGYIDFAGFVFFFWLINRKFSILRRMLINEIVDDLCVVCWGFEFGAVDLSLTSSLDWMMGFLQRDCASLLLAGNGHLLVVRLGVHQFGEDFARMSGRIVVVGVLAGFPLRTLLATIAAVHVFVMVEVVVLVFVGVLGGHIVVVGNLTLLC